MVLNISWCRRVWGDPCKHEAHTVPMRKSNSLYRCVICVCIISVLEIFTRFAYVDIFMYSLERERMSRSWWWWCWPSWQAHDQLVQSANHFWCKAWHFCSQGISPGVKPLGRTRCRGHMGHSGPSPPVSQSLGPSNCWDVHRMAWPSASQLLMNRRFTSSV